MEENKYYTPEFTPGKTFNDLTVIKGVGKHRWGGNIYLCSCVCGKTTNVRATDLRTGNTKSCGCLMIRRIKEINTTHGHCPSSAPSKLYSTYKKMVDRCHNPNTQFYNYYGGRGIKVCDAWKASFELFVKDMGTPPSIKHSIDRIDCNGDYEPKNCRWATYLEQSLNKTNTLKASFLGVVKPLREWADIVNIPYRTLKARLYYKWTDEDILTTPIICRGGGNTRTVDLLQKEFNRSELRRILKMINV